jgi:hypothetical protein
MKILLLSILLLPVSFNSSVLQSRGQSIQAPEALCTSGVNPAECKPIVGLLAFRQLGDVIVQSTQFVISDSAAYKFERQRIEVTGKGGSQGKAYVAPDYLISGISETLFELRETNHSMVSKIYINETEACHEDSQSSTPTAFNLYQCAAELEYAIGFADGIYEGASGVINSLTRH